MKILSTLSIAALVLTLSACDSNTADDISEKVNDVYENTKEMAVEITTDEASNEIKETVTGVSIEMTEPLENSAEEAVEQLEEVAEEAVEQSEEVADVEG
jgi:hypothetical protein